MAQFSQEERDEMRREAARRSDEMRQGVKPKAVQSIAPPREVYSEKYTDYPPPRAEKKIKTTKERIPLLHGLLQGKAMSEIDGDTMLILALLVMLYRDGGFDACEKKLLMALV